MVVQRRIFVFFDGFARSLRLGIEFVHRHFGGVGFVLPTVAGGRFVVAVAGAVDDFAVAVVAGAVILRDVVNLHSDGLYCFQKHETC